MATDVFTEHLGVISALRENYARTEDASAVAGVVRAQQEVAAACSEREQQVKEAIKGMYRGLPGRPTTRTGRRWRRRPPCPIYSICYAPL